MKDFFVSCLFVFFSFFLSAQNENSKTILFLIPFYGDSFDDFQADDINTCEDIYAYRSFDLAGFWEGAQMALQEYEDKGVPLRVIVKDVTGDKEKLLSIMENTELMKSVDLIIGPFFSSMFTIAAPYAEKYKIPIVNPFTTRSDLIINHSYAYKTIPAREAKPKKINDYFLLPSKNFHLLLWTDSTDISEKDAVYTNYFDDNNIPYTHIASGNYAKFHKALSFHKHNVAVVLLNNDASIMNAFREMSNADTLPDLSLIVPEKWLQSDNIDFDYLNKMKVHFFSNYHVDYKDDKTVYFIANFIEKFGSNPDIHRFSFQGYDITKYFIECILHQQKNEEVNVHPLSLEIQPVKIPNGGYENGKIRLLKFENFEIKEVK